MQELSSRFDEAWWQAQPELINYYVPDAIYQEPLTPDSWVTQHYPYAEFSPPRNGYILAYPTYLDLLYNLRWPFAATFLPGGVRGDEFDYDDVDTDDDAVVESLVGQYSSSSIRAWVRWLDVEIPRAMREGPPPSGRMEAPPELDRNIGGYVFLNMEALASYVASKGDAARWRASFPGVPIEADSRGNVLLTDPFLRHLATILADEEGAGHVDLAG